MTTQDLNFAISNTTARLYLLPEGAEINFREHITIDFMVNGHYMETAEISGLHRYGTRIDLLGICEATQEEDIYHPNDIFNPSDILKIFEACKEARPDLF